jgi:hypothetical protein
MQVARLDLDYCCETRSEFTLPEWRELLVNAMSSNPKAYTPRQQLFLPTRLLPMVQRRVTLIELAPKGTGKSFIFQNLSRHARVVSGGKVTAPVLFYNLASQTPGFARLIYVATAPYGQNRDDQLFKRPLRPARFLHPPAHHDQRPQVASIERLPPRTVSNPNGEARLPLLVAQFKCQVEFGTRCAIMGTVGRLAHGKFFSGSLPFFPRAYQ